MSDPSRSHATVIHALLNAVGDYTVYLGGVTDTDADLTYPYLVVWPPPGARTRTDLAGSSSDLTTVTQITAVGRDAVEVLAALDRVAVALQGVRPTLDGRAAGQIHQAEDFTPPPVVQSDASRTADGRPVFRGVAMYRLHSTPA